MIVSLARSAGDRDGSARRPVSPDRGNRESWSPTPRLMWRPKHASNIDMASTKSADHLGLGQGGLKGYTLIDKLGAGGHGGELTVEAVGRNILAADGATPITAP
mmetsp:Transcript_59058/g.169592  ORF Transcript_59058/g.169592 Transcript_59058/m.169592 type:complete len:104 (-) Transcript_59058:188-499(-)